MTPKERKAHFDRVAAIGCMAEIIVWQNYYQTEFKPCGQPATIQHCRAGSMKDRGVNRAKGKKNSDWLVIGLCAKHHFLEEGIDGSMGVKTWESRYGKQADMIDKLCKIFNLDLWAKAAEVEERKPTVRSKKMIAREGFV